MNMLIEELQGLASSTSAWVVVGIMALLAAASLVQYFACPIANGRHKPTDTDVQRAKDSGFRPGWRFGTLMFSGGILTFAGLLMIAQGAHPTLGLGAVMLGILLVQTEPQRLQIREGQRMVIASRDAAAGVLEGARDRLRTGQKGLASSNIILLVGLIAGLMAFQ
ncbi:MAG: hypothetical protein AAF439_07230 [Pseudomonadota bacterium]